MRKKQHFLQHKEKNTKETYTDGSKSTTRKVCFAMVFTNITRRGAFPKDATIHTAEMTVIYQESPQQDYPIQTTRYSKWQNTILMGKY